MWYSGEMSEEPQSFSPGTDDPCSSDPCTEAEDQTATCRCESTTKWALELAEKHQLRSHKAELMNNHYKATVNQLELRLATRMPAWLQLLLGFTGGCGLTIVALKLFGVT